MKKNKKRGGRLNWALFALFCCFADLLICWLLCSVQPISSYSAGQSILTLSNGLSFFFLFISHISLYFLLLFYLYYIIKSILYHCVFYYTPLYFIGYFCKRQLHLHWLSQFGNSLCYSFYAFTTFSIFYYWTIRYLLTY